MIPTKRTKVCLEAMEHYVLHLQYMFNTLCPGHSVFSCHPTTHLHEFMKEQGNGSLPSKIAWCMALKYLESLNKTAIEESDRWFLEEDGLLWYLSTKKW